MKKPTIAVTVIFASLCCNSQAHELSNKHVARQACDVNQLKDPCSYTLRQARYTGSCQSFNGQLMCVRQKPIEFLTEQSKAEHNH